jgi:hypothetical protein
MCYTKQILYAQCDHWSRTLTPCSNQNNMKQCPMVILPDVKHDDNCPRCTSDMADLHANLGVLHHTDRFRAASYETYQDMHPAFRPVNYRSQSCYMLNDMDNQGLVVRGLNKLYRRIAMHDPEHVSRYDGYHPSELPREPSPPYSPLGGRRWSCPSPPSTASSWEDSYDNASCSGIRGDDEDWKHSSHKLDLSSNDMYTMMMRSHGKLGRYNGSINHHNSRHFNTRFVTQHHFERRRISKNTGAPRCKDGSHRVLDHPADDIDKQLCMYHKDVSCEDLRNAPCRR